MYDLQPYDLQPWQRRIIEQAMEAHSRGERLVLLMPRRPGWSPILDALKVALDADTNPTRATRRKQPRR